MEVRTDSKNGECVLSATDTIKAFQAKTEARKDQWAQELRDDERPLFGHRTRRSISMIAKEPGNW